jgi:hypothetical protein
VRAHNQYFGRERGIGATQHAKHVRHSSGGAREARYARVGERGSIAGARANASSPPQRVRRSSWCDQGKPLEVAAVSSRLQPASLIRSAMNALRASRPRSEAAPFHRVVGKRGQHAPRSLDDR